MATEIIGSQLIATTGVLTPRETETALWIAEGKTRDEAAIILACAPRTVGNHLASAMDKLQARNVPALVTRLWISGVIRARAASAVFLMGLVLLSSATHIDQARLRPSRSGGRALAARAARRGPSLSNTGLLDELGLNWS